MYVVSLVLAVLSLLWFIAGGAIAGKVILSSIDVFVDHPATSDAQLAGRGLGVAMTWPLAIQLWTLPSIAMALLAIVFKEEESKTILTPPPSLT